MSENKLTVLMASDTLDRAYLGFMIANGARSMGLDVEIFFALWGLNLLRRKPNQPGLPPDKDNEKSASSSGTLGLLQKMMKKMMPQGPDQTKLSQMNFGGLGPKMMEKIMKEKGISTLPELMDLAVETGVKFTVCSMTMDLLGIQKEELLNLPNIQFAGIVSCLGQAVNSKLFIVF